MIEGLPPTVSDACPVCTMNPPHLLGLVFTEQERRPYTWRSKGSETPCQIITDLHEWRNNLSTVSEAVNMKSNWVCRCTPCTRRWDGKTLCTLTHKGGYEIKWWLSCHDLLQHDSTSHIQVDLPNWCPPPGSLLGISASKRILVVSMCNRLSKILMLDC